jgi:demethylmenaquinone methyltransferase/2-methoxy-6-polyprenyl-1,4-benzoquinol methylase
MDETERKPLLRGYTRWSGASGRRKQMDASVASTRRASFGIEDLPAESKPARVRAHFDSVAKRYDFMNTLLSLGMHLWWKRVAVSRLELAAGERVLDVCGGTGDLAALAARRVGPSGLVAVCDMTRSMLHEGRRKRSASTFSWIQGDAERIPLPDGCVDAALLGFGLRNLTYPERGLAEMARVLRPDGRFACLEFSRPENPALRALYDLYSFTLMPLLGRIFAGNGLAYRRMAESIRFFPLPGEVAAMMRRAGFDRIGVKRLSNGIAVLHTARRAAPAS